jgi:hypothetical protein
LAKQIKDVPDATLAELREGFSYIGEINKIYRITIQKWLVTNAARHDEEE